ncbi:hypothetical protein D6D08_08035 [Aureobasidium pullulans]|nr:hypothetical protein D6D08_08035 [Aureobasidium pullulans]
MWTLSARRTECFGLPSSTLRGPYFLTDQDRFTKERQALFMKLAKRGTRQQKARRKSDNLVPIREA